MNNAARAPKNWEDQGESMGLGSPFSGNLATDNRYNFIQTGKIIDTVDIHRYTLISMYTHHNP